MVTPASSRWTAASGGSIGSPSVASNSVVSQPIAKKEGGTHGGHHVRSGGSVGSAEGDEEEDGEPPPPPQLRELEPAPQALPAHAGPMTCMRLSRDGRFVGSSSRVRRAIESNGRSRVL